MDAKETVTALKEKLGAETDADLARKLRVDKSTVASWKSRGNVPQRYASILDGASHQQILTPILQWSDIELHAFKLALFRFCHAAKTKIDTADYRGNVSLFQHASPFFKIMNEAQRDLISVMDEREYNLQTAFAIIIYEDNEEISDGISRAETALQMFDPDHSDD